MEKIVVNDTNVFIDLLSVGLLEDLFSLPWEIHTTNFVMLELLREGQHESVTDYKNSGRLHIPVFEEEELNQINNIYQKHRNKTNVSFTDCSVWYYAKTNNYVLLTGDRKLRESALINGVEVHGVIYVIDKLVEYGAISDQVASKKLNLLNSINHRLPMDEIKKRLDLWKSK